MKTQVPSRKRGLTGLSLVELLVMLGVIALIAGILLPRWASERAQKERSRNRIRCVSNLKNVGLAFRIFATDNSEFFPARLMVSNGVELPSIDLMRVYRSLSNELSTPKLLHCGSDKERELDDWSKINFDTMTAKNVSYFTSLSANENRPEIMLGGDRNLMTNRVAVGPGLLGLATNAQVRWTKEMHNEQGNVVMSDGSVMQMSSSRLKFSLKDQDIATNYLVMP